MPGRRGPTEFRSSGEMIRPRIKKHAIMMMETNTTGPAKAAMVMMKMKTNGNSNSTSDIGPVKKSRIVSKSLMRATCAPIVARSV